MQTHFSTEFFRKNRSTLREKLKQGTPIVVPSSGILQRNGDTTYPFVQDSNFWYLTGIEEADCVLVMTKTSEFLIVPERDAVRVTFDGALNNDELTHRSGITEVLTEHDGWKRLRADLGTPKQIAVPEAASMYVARHGLYTNPARKRILTKLKRIYPNTIYIDIRPHLASLRCVKQPAELAALQEAIDSTTATIADVRNSTILQSFDHEYELEAAITQGFRVRGTTGHAFEPIVANGKKATTLHNTSNNGPLILGQLTILDIGAEVEHYAADISRTISARKPTTRQLAVHTAVVEVQDYALSLLRPGTDMLTYEKSVSEKLGEKLQQLGLIKTLDRTDIHRYFPHATSHFLGLDTHDVGDYRKPLEAGMVITCEPGIYIPEEGIGVRIEDDVLITSTDNEVLSAACPREVF